MTKAVTTLLAKIDEDHSKISNIDVKAFTPHQMINLLQELIDRPALSIETLRTLGSEYKIDSSKNSEILYRCVNMSFFANLADLTDLQFDSGTVNLVKENSFICYNLGVGVR